MEQNNFNGQERTLQNDTVHHTPHESTFTQQDAYDPKMQQTQVHNGSGDASTTQQPVPPHDIHHSNQQYTTSVHDNPAYTNTSSYENNHAPTSNGNNTMYNKKLGGYGPFMLMALLVAIVITAVVIGAGWAVFYPKPTTSVQTLVPPNTSATTQDNVSTTDTDSSSTSDDVVIIYGGKNDRSTPTAKTPRTNTSATSAVASPPKTSTQKTAETPKTSKTMHTGIASTVPHTKTTSKTVVTKHKPSSTPSATAAVPAPSKPNKNTTKYWIQVFSTNNRDKATQIKKNLGGQGIKAVVITKTIDSKIYYRLRIGPYYNKDEGQKFLEWVRRNDKYKDAYISVDNRT